MYVTPQIYRNIIHFLLDPAKKKPLAHKNKFHANEIKVSKEKVNMKR